jgi:ribonuclease-3
VSLWGKFFGKKLSEKDRLFSEAITNLTGAPPVNLNLYKLASLHSSLGKVSKDGFKESNERLEFLGDAILSMVIAEYLFKKYPFENEGFLTEIRSRIVKRDSLNKLARKLGVPNLVELQDKNQKRGNSIYGNALEAVIGAVFLDRGYAFCKQFILSRIVDQHLDLKKIIHTDTNYKSKIIEWAQKESKDVVFESLALADEAVTNKFEVLLSVDGVQISTGTGSSKKRAEQQAAWQACEMLKLL